MSILEAPGGVFSKARVYFLAVYNMEDISRKIVNLFTLAMDLINNG